MMRHLSRLSADRCAIACLTTHCPDWGVVTRLGADGRDIFPLDRFTRCCLFHSRWVDTTGTGVRYFGLILSHISLLLDHKFENIDLVIVQILLLLELSDVTLKVNILYLEFINFL